MPPKKANKAQPEVDLDPTPLDNPVVASVPPVEPETPPVAPQEPVIYTIGGSVRKDS